MKTRGISVAGGLLVAGLAVAWLATGLAAAASPAAVRVISHGSRDRPRIALTFDDGVSPANCRRILAVLVEERVPATFFPTAAAMRLDPALWRLVAEVGDPVGDHTLTHPHMPTLGAAAQFREIARARRLGESILGRPMLRVFRPPYGAYDARTLTAVAKAGFGTVLLWDVSDRDTSRHGSLAKMLAAAERGTNGSVVLMHCGPNATPYLIRPLIDHYRARGFRFVTVAQLLGLRWQSGPTVEPAQTEILGDLAPLPSSPVGGPIIGPNRYSPPPPSSAIPSPSTAPSPVGTGSAKPGRATASPSASNTPSSPFAPDATSGEPGSPSSGVSAGAPAGTAADPGPVLATLAGLLVLVVLAVLAVALLLVWIARRRR